MPFTPFHLGPALLFGFLFFQHLDFPTFLIANVIVDLEPFLILVLGLDLPLHGFFHSFPGGTIVALALACAMMRGAVFLKPVMGFFRLEQEHQPRGVFAAALSGVYLHILLDARLYTDIEPFYPLSANPFLSGSMFAGFEVYTFCVISGLAGVVLYLVRIRKGRGQLPSESTAGTGSSDVEVEGYGEGRDGEL